MENDALSAKDEELGRLHEQIETAASALVAAQKENDHLFWELQQSRVDLDRLVITQRSDLTTAKQEAWDRAIEIVLAFDESYSDGDGLRTLDPRGLKVLAETLEQLRDEEKKRGGGKVDC